MTTPEHPLPTTRYDTQLVERYGSIDAFHRLPALSLAAFLHTKLAETEDELRRLCSSVSTLTATGSYADTGLVIRLDWVLNAMDGLIKRRDQDASTLQSMLGLTEPATEPPTMFDPHWRLTPAPGTARTVEKASTPTGDGPGADTLSPHWRRTLTAFDDRVEALVGPLDQVRILAQEPGADPDLRELNSNHLAVTDAETTCLFYRARINMLADGRWYVDKPLVSSIDDALTELETSIATREDRARVLEQQLARMEANTHGSAAPAVSTPSAAAAAAASASRRTAAEAVSPAVQHHGTAAGSATAPVPPASDLPLATPPDQPRPDNPRSL